jgi:2-keto-4-pentenoate hydratase/2-oxohepta-3-ene-1,7-dioic acid hydratase in catechol pathway
VKITRFCAAGRERFGVVEKDQYCDLSGSLRDYAELASLCVVGNSDEVRGAVARAPRFALSEVTRLVPLTGSYKVFCAALNYRDHVQEVKMEVPSQPLFFFKFPESMIDPDSAIPIPRITQFLDYEAELGVVIGRSGRDIPEERALDHVLGYCVVNEVSARDLQVRKDGARPIVDWFSGKGLDGVAPIGPWIVTRESVADAGDLGVQAWLNGELVQNSRTSQLIFSIPKMISYISQRVMLRPFDVIATGTPSGVGHARGRALQPGDVVKIGVEHVGELSNRIVAGA